MGDVRPGRVIRCYAYASIRFSICSPMRYAARREGGEFRSSYRIDTAPEQVI